MNNFLEKAINLSRESIKRDGFPVGVIVVKNGKIIGEGISSGKKNIDATSHAEIEAIRTASKKLNNCDLFGCEIYSSMEPCIMCFSACYWSKIKKIVYVLGKNKLSRQYYEGKHSLIKINLMNNRKIKIIHDKKLENEALSVIKSWESLKK